MFKFLFSYDSYLYLALGYNYFFIMKVFALFFEDISHTLLDTNSVLEGEDVQVLKEARLGNMFNAFTVIVLHEAYIFSELWFNYQWKDEVFSFLID